MSSGVGWCNTGFARTLFFSMMPLMPASNEQNAIRLPLVSSSATNDRAYNLWSNPPVFCFAAKKENHGANGCMVS